MSIEDLKKIADIGGMGNGERDNATRTIGIDRAGPYAVAGDLVRVGDELRRVVASPESVLQEADRLVSTDRGSTYGPPSLDFGKVTGMALALWGRGPESPEEHALYMVLVKLARLQATPGHHDSIVDAAGYLKTYAMVIEERVKRITDKG